MKGAKISTRETLLMATIGVLVAGWVVPRVPFVRRLTQSKALAYRNQMQTIIDAIYSTGQTTPVQQQQMDDIMSRLNTAGYNVFIDTKNAPLVVLGYSNVTTSIV